MTSKPPFGGEVVSFPEAFAEVSRGVRKVKQRDYLPSGLHPIIDQGQGLVAGYSDETEGLFKDVPAIVFGDHTRCVKYVEEPFFAGADGVKILKPKLSNNVRYWYHALRSTPLENLGYSRHFKLLKQTRFFNPNKDGQAAIVERLDIIEGLCCLINKEEDGLDALVKSRFVEMFGDPVANPMGWDAEMLGHLGTLKNGLNFKAEDSGYEVTCLGVGDFNDLASIDNMSLLGKVGLIERPKQDCFLKDGDIVFVRSNGNKALVGRCLAVYPHDSELVYSGFCIRFRLGRDTLRVPFLVWTLKQPSMRAQLMGRGSNVKNLNQRILSTLEVPVPPINLQDEFISFAAHVDKLRFIVLEFPECRCNPVD